MRTKIVMLAMNFLHRLQTFYTFYTLSQLPFGKMGQSTTKYVAMPVHHASFSKRKMEK